MSNWLTRLQPNIKLTSPSGAEFIALWKGGERTIEKKIGIHTYPDIAGDVIQDLNVNSMKYPLDIFFTGKDHDLTADLFMTAFKENGLWEVVHPTKGILSLQFTSIREGINPVSEGNMSPFTIACIEHTETNIEISNEELQSNVETELEKLNSVTLQGIVDATLGAVGSARNAVNNVTKKITAAIDSVLGPITQLNDGLHAEFNSIIRGIDNTITAAILAPDVLAGQLINLVQLPSKIIADTTQKIATYGVLIEELYGLDGSEKEIFAVKDLVLSASIGAVSIVASETNAVTQTEIIDQVEAISIIFDNTINNLDTDMAKVETDKIENQYISMESSFSQNLLISSLAVNYLLQASLNLASEKVIILKEPTLPLMLTIREYGTDEQFDFFAKTNNLKPDEYLLLEAGREVFVYPGVVA